MQITVSLGDILTAAGIIVPGGCGALYWAVRMAIRAAVKDLEIEVAKGYMSKDTCTRIRDECERHRHDLAEAAQAQRLRKG